MRVLAISALVIGTALVGACRKEAKEDAGKGVRIEDMSSGRISMVMTLEPPVVRLDRDVLLTVKIVSPSEIDVTMPSFGDRLTGFISTGSPLDSEPVSRDGKTTLERRIRLTPTLADVHRIGPTAIVYSDRSKSPAESGWFPTRPIVLQRVSPIDGSPPGDIEDAIKPVWIYPSGRTILIGIVSTVLGIAVLWLLWRLAKRVHRQIKLMRMSPRERALFELAELLAKDLVHANMVKEFYVELTLIVRRYVERRHSIRAPEQTTEEFLLAVSKDSRFSSDVVKKLKSFLESADLVKFAADHPDEEAIAGATSTARVYIETDSPEKIDTGKGS